jgi:capreomycidine synthase
MSAMEFEPAPLEEWMRRFYFETDVDIGSSGVADLSFGRLRDLVGVPTAELDRLVLRDSTSWGGAALREAVAARWGDGKPDRVMATHGASEAIYLVLHALLEPGDEVVAVEPVYHALVSSARTMGCVVRPWPLRAERGFAPDLADLEPLLGARTKLVVVNFPHNPTGTTLTAAQRDRLLDLVAGVDAHLLWDNAFADLVHGAPPLRNPAADYRKAVAVGTLSKAYGLPGLRFGWCIADPGLLERMIVLRDRMTLHLSPLIELLACHVAEHADRILAEVLPRVAANRTVLLDWAARHPDLVDLPAPLGGVTAFPLLRRFPDTEPLCRQLATRDRVLLVPGSCFGRPDRVRLGFGGATDELRAGLDLLTAALQRTPTDAER